MRELGNWYSRGYVPHFDEAGTEQVITYRLADALPEEALRKIEDQATPNLGAPVAGRHDRKAGGPPALPTAAQRPENLERYLDAGYGCCALGVPRHANAVVDAWRHFDGERYRLLAWVVMPNHVHVLASVFPGVALGRLVQMWKSYTARKILATDAEGCFLARRVWQREYWDRFIRDDVHRAAAIR